MSEERIHMRLLPCLSWLWKASAGCRLHIGLCTSVFLVHTAFSLALVWVSKHVIDLVTGAASGRLTASIVLLGALLLGRMLLSAGGNYLSSLSEIRLRNRLRHDFFASLMNRRGLSPDGLHSGDVLNRLEEDLARVTDALCSTLPSAALTVFQFAGAFWILCSLDLKLAGILIFIMPAALVLSKGYVLRMRRLTREIRDLDSREQIHMQEHLQHRTLVSSLEYTGRSLHLLSALQDRLAGRFLHRTRFSLFSRFMVQLGFGAGYLTAFLWGIYGIRDGSVTFGMMTAFLQLVNQIQNPMVEFSRQVPAFIRVVTSVERLEELRALPQEEEGSPVRLEGPVGLRIDRLVFSYEGQTRKVFDGFSHDFTPGSLTALVGETGAGKTTLVRLVLALLEPQGGSLALYDGTRSVPVSPMTRCNLVYVPQGNSLLSGTVRDNLLLGCPEAGEERLRAALHTAAADFVLDLPQGLDTVCGESGTGLSEGQAQRIAIARGLLRPGSLLLLDEPTSALDRDTAGRLLERLSAAVAGKTVILITHRDLPASLCPEVLHL